MSEIGFWDATFTQPQVVRLTKVTAATLDNWLRYAHVQPARVEDGKRLFSFADLLTIDCMEMMISVFRMPPSIAASFGRRAVEQYEPGFAADRASISSGAHWASAMRDLDGHFSFAREGENVVALEEGEVREDSIMLILPTRMIARRLLSAMATVDA